MLQAKYLVVEDLPDPICKIPLAMPSWLLLVIFYHMPTHVEYLLYFCLILKKFYSPCIRQCGRFRQKGQVVIVICWHRNK